MATPKEIPSKVNSAAATAVEASAGNSLYIVGCLKAGDLTVVIKSESIDCGSVGPVAFGSPIECDSFTPALVGQVAYYEQ